MPELAQFLAPASEHPDSPRILRIEAHAIEDALAVSASPGSLLIEVRDADVLEVGNRHPIHAHLKVLAAGPPALVDRHPLTAKAAIIHRPGDVLIPGLINAHAHLDLTHIGPRPHDPAAGFLGFVDLVRAHRRLDDDAIAESVRLGIESSLKSGVVAIGDIAGSVNGRPSLAPFDELSRSPLWGTSFLEFFAIGNGEANALEQLEEAVAEGVRRVRNRRMNLGLSPHAPNTVSKNAYMRAIELAKRHALPLMTHLAETPEERDFIAAATGPQRQLLERLGMWNDDLLRDIGRGNTPIKHLEGPLSYGDFIATHCNFLTHQDIGILMDTRTRVAYCPRASTYFATADAFGPHRFTDLLFCGIKVALGTDSIINLGPANSDPTLDHSPQQPPARAPELSILEEMRLLYRRDAIRAITLLGMVTLDAAAVLGLDPLSFTFKRGAAIAGIVAIPSLRPLDAPVDLAIDRILIGNGEPQLLAIGK